MKGLQTLIKLQKSRVDEQRQILAKIQAHLDRIIQAIAELEILQAREQVAAQEHPEMTLTYGEFVKRSLEQARELEKNRQATETAVDLARDRLAQLFEEQKRYEIALANRLAAEKREEERRETIFLDEVGSIGFIRKEKRA